MSTPHINAKDGAFAKVVLMPGDPLRAKWIAETFLHDYEEVTNVRGILGFTGYTKNNVRISVMASGMGQPSIGIYSYELFTQYGVEAIIRVGTAGSYQKDVHVGEVVIANGSCTDSNWMVQFDLNGGVYSAVSSFSLLEHEVAAARNQGKRVHIGNVLSSDFFYNPDDKRWKNWEDLGVLAVEMESFALFCNAARTHKKAGCVLTISDSFYKEAQLTPEERQTKLRDMIEIAIEAAEMETNAAL